MTIDKNIILFDFNINEKTPLDYLKEIIDAENIEEVIVVVFSSGKKNLEKLNEVTKNVKNKIIVISGYMKRMQKPSYNYLTSLDDWKINFKNTHTKYILAKSEKNNYIINSTSNLNSNSKYEVTEIVNSEKEYNFIKDFFVN